jgi:hypothetical protein
MTLLANPSLTLELTMLISIGTAIFVIGGAWAVIRFQTDAAMKKITKNEEGDLKLAEEVHQMSAAVKENMKEMEKTMIRRIDSVRESHNGVHTKLTVIENDLGHVKSEVERQRKKITMMGRMAPPTWPPNED